MAVRGGRGVSDKDGRETDNQTKGGEQKSAERWGGWVGEDGGPLKCSVGCDLSTDAPAKKPRRPSLQTGSQPRSLTSEGTAQSAD